MHFTNISLFVNCLFYVTHIVLLSWFRVPIPCFNSVLGCQHDDP